MLTLPLHLVLEALGVALHVLVTLGVLENSHHGANGQGNSSHALHGREAFLPLVLKRKTFRAWSLWTLYVAKFSVLELRYIAIQPLETYPLHKHLLQVHCYCVHWTTRCNSLDNAEFLVGAISKPNHHVVGAISKPNWCGYLEWGSIDTLLAFYILQIAKLS